MPFKVVFLSATNYNLQLATIIYSHQLQSTKIIDYNQLQSTTYLNAIVGIASGISINLQEKVQVVRHMMHIW